MNLRRYSRIQHLGAWIVTALIAVLAGCGRAGNTQPVAQQPPAATGQSQEKEASKTLTADQAEASVLKERDVQAYIKAVEAKGWKVVLQTKETPTRFMIIVGEDQKDRVVNTLWYLVSKADGTVTEWDITKGQTPTD